RYWAQWQSNGKARTRIDWPSRSLSSLGTWRVAHSLARRGLQARCSRAARRQQP
ncbi:hypothetical protein H4S04_008420, partial [Coemansia sp. S16]